ncbi:glutamine amidotransferase-related protein [Natronospira bacteriovora]|uniref:Gamma-glutamyl-gamma-aminobutyrate hydrolase family protein n=1 Tax=Natronospira bacteriovora TaxID=3069753 RepID=A0ABU0W8L7_9GAMM|nr:gamma-glutamyl-gamma-aminobutyrate hydrolase family protein [Natronospira sp. AB-CW4]MDQ2070253.1 gamma-glutamyl-gamma-aminobutyrate hydrolase family protein [Natronospira sp. AB-CW4]
MSGAESQLLLIRQVPGKGLGALEPLFRNLGYRIDRMDAPVDDLAGVPALAADLVVIMGGPMCALDDQRFPWLREQRRLIEARLEANRPTLGICLGAQLIALALGGQVHRDGARELGWSPIQLTPQGQASCLRYLESVPVLHWHRDAIELPSGVDGVSAPATPERLAYTEACPVQALSLGNALGLQFHPEVGPRQMPLWLASHIHELDAHPTQSLESMRLETRRCANWMNQRAEFMLREWLASVAEWPVSGDRTDPVVHRGASPQSTTPPLKAEHEQSPSPQQARKP